jgi:predicted ABC-type ATPase
MGPVKVLYSNIARVQDRVAKGGHGVPLDKIKSRYFRSLDLLIEAIQCCDRAYIFDNSSHERLWIAEFTAGKELKFQYSLIPRWFQNAVIDKNPGLGSK